MIMLRGLQAVSAEQTDLHFFLLHAQILADVVYIKPVFKLTTFKLIKFIYCGSSHFKLLLVF